MISQFFFCLLTILLCLINPLLVIQVNAQSQRIKIPTSSITQEAQEVCQTIEKLLQMD